MFHNLLDPVILFFLTGILAKLLKVPLSIHTSVYDTISIYLLLAIGLKGGYELSLLQDFSFLIPALGAVLVGLIVPTIVFLVTSKFARFSREDCIILAAHYGAGSAVTFAVVLNYLEDSGLRYENFFTIFLILIEIVGILTAFSFLHLNKGCLPSSLKKIFRDVILNKSIFLLIAGLLVGWISSVTGLQHVKILFIDLFKGILCFFMLEMGLVCGQEIPKIRQNALFILLFGIGMPILSALVAILIGNVTSLSTEGITILATIAASASYIAAPAVSRSILPDCDVSIPLTCALGVTFPFNVIFGIPLYHSIASSM